MCKTLSSPIRFLHHKIKGALNHNNSSFYDAIKGLTSTEKNKITISSKKECGWKELAAKCNLDKDCIVVSECYLCSIWCCSYLTITTYESINNFYNKELKALLIPDEAIELYNYAKSLTYSYDDWPMNLPIPQDEADNKLVETVNISTIIAIDVLLLHEMSHIYLKHKKGAGAEQEIWADTQVLDWIINKNNKQDVYLQLAIISMFFTLLLMDPKANKDNENHPSSFKRLMNILNKFDINENDILWSVSCVMLGIWARSFCIEIDLNNINQIHLKSDLSFCYARLVGDINKIDAK